MEKFFLALLCLIAMFLSVYNKVLYDQTVRSTPMEWQGRFYGSYSHIVGAHNLHFWVMTGITYPRRVNHI